MCRPCRAKYKQEHYAANRTKYIDNAVGRRRRIGEERMRMLIQYLRTHPCVDCGETDVLVLEFDHLGDKSFSIGAGFRDRSLEALLDEMAKCEVVCANCHRRRTATRGGYLRAAVAQR
jgi:5-methylcytosine-specific restriction endonuclease McrA